MKFPKKYAALRAELSRDELLFGKIAVPELFTAAAARFHREIADLLIVRKLKKLRLARYAATNS